MPIRRCVLVLLPCLLLLACSSPQPKSEARTEAAPAPDPVTGRYAFHQMFASARTWAADVQPLRLESAALPQFKSGEGKSGVWRASFLSPSRRQERIYTYSVADVNERMAKGVTPASEEPASSQSNAFPLAALRKDSDEAYQTALEHSATYRKEHPDMPVGFLLEKNKQTPNVAWRVFWGDSLATSGYSVLVDASTGDFVRTLR